MSFADFFFFSSRRRHTRLQGDWSSDVCSSDLRAAVVGPVVSGRVGIPVYVAAAVLDHRPRAGRGVPTSRGPGLEVVLEQDDSVGARGERGTLRWASAWGLALAAGGEYSACGEDRHDGGGSGAEWRHECGLACTETWVGRAVFSHEACARGEKLTRGAAANYDGAPGDRCARLLHASYTRCGIGRAHV